MSVEAGVPPQVLGGGMRDPTIDVQRTASPRPAETGVNSWTLDEEFLENYMILLPDNLDDEEEMPEEKSPSDPSEEAGPQVLNVLLFETCATPTCLYGTSSRETGVVCFQEIA